MSIDNYQYKNIYQTYNNRVIDFLRFVGQKILKGKM